MLKQQSGYPFHPTQYVEVNGVRFAYRRFGNPSGVPLVGFQHFTGTMDNWDPIIINALAEDREVILFDNAGVGNSDGVTPDRVAEMTKDAVALVSALHLSKIDVLGFSLGGFIAQYLAHFYPSLVRKLIIVGAAPQGVTVLNSFADLIAKGMSKDAAERFLFIFFTPSIKSRAIGREVVNRLFERQEDRDQETKSESVAAQSRAIMAWGTDPVDIDLSSIQHPVLIIQGSNDEMMDSDNSYALFKQLPNAILSYYPDSAHGSFYQYPDLFVNEAKFFLNKI